MRQGLAPLVLVALLLSGCTSTPEDGGPSDAPGSPAPRPDVEIRAERPEWRIGQGWRYVMDVPGRATHTVTMMVAEERDDLWVVAAADRDQALHHALFSLSPFLGRNGKETLSPYQGGEPVRMYDFPLVDGKRWTAGFFGEPMEFRARFVGDIALQPELGLGAFAQGFRVTASGASGTQVRFDFVEAASWFTHFELLGPGGERRIRFDLVGLVDGHRGPYHFFRGEDLAVESFRAATGEPSVEEAAVPAPERPADGLALAVSYLGRPATLPPVANVTLWGPPEEPPRGTLYSQHGFLGSGHRFARVDVPVDPACLDADEASCSGGFRLEAVLAGEVELEVRVVAYQVFAEGAL